MPRMCVSVCTRLSFPILEWSFYFCSKLSGVLDELAKTVLLLSDFLNKLFGMCNDKVGIFPC